LFDLLSNYPAVELIIVLFLGALFGSFTTAIIYRTRHNQSWVWNKLHEHEARSFCPSCQHVLGVKDLVPVLSWLLQKGCCRYCKEPIAKSYIYTEVTLIIVALFIYGLLGLSLHSLAVMILSPFIVSQTILMIQYKMISKLLLSIMILGGMLILFL